ncbi:hypothetical protein CR194_11725 [Salipaludibacillus keqinensis]|uniref:NERD domain-containing protein n=1 Tax=Salipaludibacillus keqinensis TaxID=2045207 RepID=A0A323TGB5_9BACI|nr:NERD domain-containing protein [Salipaludibacillus keqinensis]PYZ93809.1 hypothetical protein CR194_11725 [Salipaludibacillus keqinensis]
MAQLVKLSDYVSRYEIDVYRYPSRYVRLKKERWERLKQDWEAERKGYEHLPTWNIYENNEESLLQRSWNKLLRKKHTETKEEMSLPSKNQLSVQSIEQLKQAYRDELFQFQMNWASSTVSEISQVKRSYYYDSLLNFLVKQLPDTCFIFYNPVFMLKQAQVDLDVIILTPTEIRMIKPLFGNSRTIFQAETDRFWIRNHNEKKERFIHPYISLNRMRTVLQGLLEEMNVTLPMKHVVLAKDSFIDVSSTNKRVQLIDKRNFQQFRQTLLKNQTPIKNQQLKIADKFLSHSLTISENRVEGNRDRFDENSHITIEKD